MEPNNGLNLKVVRLNRYEGHASLKAFADVLVAEKILLKGLKLIDGSQGRFVGMPGFQGKDGKWRDHVAVLDRDFKERLTGLVTEAYENGVEEVLDTALLAR